MPLTNRDPIVIGDTFETLVEKINLLLENSDFGVEAIVGAMVSGNTETGINVTYDSVNKKLNFVVTSSGGAVDPEEVQDIVGAMFQGGTQVGITVTYNDANGTINMAVTDSFVNTSGDTMTGNLNLSGTARLIKTATSDMTNTLANAGIVVGSTSTTGIGIGRNKVVAFGNASSFGSVSDHDVSFVRNDVEYFSMILNLIDFKKAVKFRAGLDMTSTKITNVAAGSDPLDAVNYNQLTTAIAAGIPAGAVMVYAMSSAPVGWLECAGQAVSRTTYSALFAAIGTTYGVGNGSTTFNLPDLRGEFIRGWDHGRGVDGSRVFGSGQAGQNFSHTHAYRDRYHAEHSSSITDATYSVAMPTNYNNKIGTQGSDRDNDTWLYYDSTTGSSGVSDGRPRNVAMMYCIKT